MSIHFHPGQELTRVPVGSKVVDVKTPWPLDHPVVGCKASGCILDYVPEVKA